MYLYKCMGIIIYVIYYHINYVFYLKGYLYGSVSLDREAYMSYFFLNGNKSMFVSV